MEITSLNGNWLAKQCGSDLNVKSQVPGCIHTDLLKAKKINDPFYRDQEFDSFWVGDSDWIFEREFNVNAELLSHSKVLLHCKGLDTLSQITINGKKVGVSDNMFRTWEYDVKKVLKSGKNKIEILFKSAVKYTEKKDKERHLPKWAVGDQRGAHPYIRKEACNFGWDWGIQAVTCGIWRDIELVSFDDARFDDVQIFQDHKNKGKTVELDAKIACETLGKTQLTAELVVKYKGKEVASTKSTLKSGKGTLNVKVSNPELWWPNNMGAQPLYEVEVKLTDKNGHQLDTWQKKVGLRTLTLDTHKDKWGESFQFVVNGIPFFSKGANWIPTDAFYNNATPERIRDLLQSSIDANMNMLRVWGGGYYEEDVFYDLCDELGICIWQDFMFACSTYPGFDKDYVANVKEEAKDSIKRLRHHACLAVWCGNNELEQGLVDDEWTDIAMSWKDYKVFFDDLLPKMVEKHDGVTRYWTGSPYTPIGERTNFNDPTCGDAHLWGVWHDMKPFEWYRTCDHRFNSEFGFQSFPEPKTTETFIEPKDRSVTSYIMEHHQRNGAGNSKIMHYMLDWFRLPTGFEETLWASQIQQGMAIKYACEHWRRSMPRGMGTLYWQLNDCWPVASWSSIDYFHRWKALHYMAKKFYAPLLLSGLENTEKGSVEMHLTHDGLNTRKLTLKWFVTDAQGKQLLEGKKSVEAGRNGNKKVHTLDLKGLLKEKTNRDCIVWIEAHERGKCVADNMVIFARPKHLELSEAPKISSKVKLLKNGSFEVIFNTKKAALWAWIEFKKADFRANDNFFHLRPGAPLTITVKPSSSLTLSQFKAELMVKSLADLSKT